MSQIIVRTAFEDNNNYMKDGILLGSGTTFVTTAAGREHLEKLGFGVLETDFSGEEPERNRV